MKLEIGQRWRFINSAGLNYIAEVIQFEPILNMQVLQIVSQDRRSPSKKEKEIFSPKVLIHKNDEVISTEHTYETFGLECQWFYLEGQDKPQGSDDI